MRCYEEMKFCNKALFKINDFQKNAAMNKKFSCQTRLLGLEANLIMAMNAKLKSAAAPTANVIGTRIAAAAPSLITLVSSTVTTIIMRMMDRSPPYSEP